MRNNKNYERYKLQYNVESLIYLRYIITFIRRQKNGLFETMKMFPEKIRWWKYKWVNRLMIVYQIISCWLVSSHRKDKSLNMIQLLHVHIYQINELHLIYIFRKVSWYKMTCYWIFISFIQFNPSFSYACLLSMVLLQSLQVYFD